MKQCNCGYIMPDKHEPACPDCHACACTSCTTPVIGNKPKSGTSVYFICAVCGSRYTGYTAWAAATNCCMRFSCNSCGAIHKSQYDTTNCCKTLSIRDLAKKMGIDQNLSMPTYASDYYLLQHLAHNSSVMGRAEILLRRKCAILERQFVPYLDMAIGGEMRYCHEYGYSYDYLPPAVNNGDARSQAWLEWSQHDTMVERNRFAVDSFREWGNGSFGGDNWAMIAEVLLLRVEQGLDVVKWLDRVWNVEHNGGCCLNKIWDCLALSQPGCFDSDCGHVLCSHGRDDYKTLLKYASPETQELWQLAQTNSKPPTVEDACRNLLVAEYKATNGKLRKELANIPGSRLGRTAALLGDIETHGLEDEQTNAYNAAKASFEQEDTTRKLLLDAIPDDDESEETIRPAVKESESAIWFQAYGRKRKYQPQRFAWGD